MSAPTGPRGNGIRVGVTLAIGAYVIWGFFPAYFLLLRPASALEIVAWRVVLSLAFCVILLTVTRGWPRLLALLHSPRILFTLAAAGVFILINWLVYIFAVLNNQVVEAALGYFTNPIVTVLLGVFVLRERLRPLQWVSVGISVIAVIVLAVGYGSFPWIALVLAFSFGLYGLIKKGVGGKVDAVSGLTIETLAIAPLATVGLIVIGATSGLAIGATPLQTIAIALVGIVTAIPLLLFAGAARRIPLTYIGLTQYLTPILQFLFGILIAHEAMPPERWIGFGLVWLALAVLTIDTFRASGRSRRLQPALA